jgi:hypothetical protein
MNVNPWIVQPPKKSAFVSIGSYSAKFEGVEEYKLQDGSDKWKWTWRVVSGEHKGKEASALTDRTIRSASLPGHLISGLLGRQLEAGEDVKQAIDACVGKVYMVSVQPGPKGGKPAVRMVATMPSM